MDGLPAAIGQGWIPAAVLLEGLPVDEAQKMSLSPELESMLESYPEGVPRETRIARGQYFTPREVCDLMLAWSVEQGSERILEPGCGTGAFLVRAWDLLERKPGAVFGIRSQLQGIERDPCAAALCALRLQTRMNMKAGDVPWVMAGDFLTAEFRESVRKGQLPRPDLIIGNPPYVRHEHLKQNADWAAQNVRRSFEGEYRDYLAEHPGQTPLFAGRGDLSVWFLLQSTALLSPGGRLAFIISNGWLDTGHGKYLRRFLIDHYTPLAMMESAVEPWFGDAAVNPIILILRRRDEKQPPDPAAPVRLIRFHQPLAGWLPSSDDPKYWTQLEQQLTPLKAGACENDAVECRTIRLDDLQNSGMRNWFFGWRAPQSLLANFQKPARWCDLETLGRIRYPLKTGINRFFYLTGEVIERFGIEPEFLRPVIKSAKEVGSLEVFAADLDLRLFSCLQSREELIAAGKTGALDYIDWGARQVAPSRQKRGRAVPWPEVSSVQGRLFWYAIPALPPADLLCSRFFDRRFFFALCGDPILEDQTFYGLTLRPEYAGQRDFVAGLLNALPTLLMTELCGRSSLGEGVLQFSREDMARLPIPNPALWDAQQQGDIARCFRELCRRPVLPVTQEFARPDRRRLDERVLAGLFPDKNIREIEALREEWVAALVRRVGERTGMAAKRRAKRRMT